MTALDKVRLAADLLEADELGGAHEHLMKDCPWYRNISEEKNCGHDPGEHCDSGKGTVKLTPRTAEASTVPEPTRPPGGPGLFHIKGRELPPYIQHLWHHLAPKYGEHKAYGMAVGIVKKWKAGINPGGFKTKSGKGKRVHADVQAAASRNIALWEKDKADAHRQSHGHVKATVSLAGDSGPTKTKPEAHYRESDSDTRRCGTCSMFRDGHCTLVQGAIEPDHVCDYWEKSKTVKLALAAPGTITAPGTKPEYGLNQRPSQTVSPSPPLPPEVKLPTAAEVRKLIGQVPDCTDASLSQSAKNHLEAAAAKLDKDDPIAALTVLRIVQSDIFAAHKADLGAGLPAVMTANVFARVPPAEQSSANKEMLRNKDKEMSWRRLEQQVAALIDRIRRKHFHGHYGSLMQQARFSAGADSQSMSLEKILRLTGSSAAEPEPLSPEVQLLLSAREDARELVVLLASDPDDDGDDDSSDGGDDDGDSGHGDHATYKALIGKKVPPAKAAAMCAKADKKVKASALAASVEEALVALAAKPMGDGGVPMHHPPFTGTHAHSHHLMAAHSHPHQHFNDNSHEAGPQHRPGSKPGGSPFGAY